MKKSKNFRKCSNQLPIANYQLKIEKRLLAFYTVFFYTSSVMRKFFTVNRIMYASAFFALCVALVLNITTQIPLAGFILVVRWIDVAVNAVAAGLCVFLFIKPELTGKLQNSRSGLGATGAQQSALVQDGHGFGKK